MPAGLGRLTLGISVAVVLVLVAVVPEVGGVDTWKIVLGAIGLALIVAAGRKPDAR